MTSELERAHARLAGILGTGAEPLSVIERAEEHRRHWRPQRTRVVLLAESHVFTEVAEIGSALRPSGDLPHDLPKGFVRLVYSIGYGEGELLSSQISEPPNRGTPQFWKIFQNCIRSPGETPDHAAVQRTGNRDQRARVREKLRVLWALRDRGVWLIDASIAALYLPGRRKPASHKREAVLQASWDSFTGSVVASAEPQAILCVGVGVMRALAPRLDRTGIPWSGVHQPQAHLSASEHAAILETYAAVCTDPHKVTSVPRFA